MDQKGLQFTPHVLAVVRGTTVRFLNNDHEDHNVYSPEGGYNLGTWAPGRRATRYSTRPACTHSSAASIPTWRRFVVVLETPYFAVTDAAGTFEIRNVAPARTR